MMGRAGYPSEMEKEENAPTKEEKAEKKGKIQVGLMLNYVFKSLMVSFIHSTSRLCASIPFCDSIILSLPSLSVEILISS